MGEINATIPEALSGSAPATLTGTVTASLTGNLVVKWIDGATEPAAPTGYVRFPALDMAIPVKVLDTAVTVQLWAFKQQ